MVKSYERYKKLKEEKYKVPRSVQDIIPIDTIYKDGIFSKGNVYTKCYKFIDINYLSASREDKNNIMINYGEMLNSFDSNVTIKITVNNRKIDINQLDQDILMELDGSYQDKYKRAYNEIIIDKLAESNNIITEKYITLSTVKVNISEARAFFGRAGSELSTYFKRIGSSCIELTTYDRLKMFHDFYRGNDEVFSFDLYDCMKKGHVFKDYIVPYMPNFNNSYFTFEGKYGRVLYISHYGGYIEEEFVSRLCEVNKSFVYSMDIFAVPKDEAVREIQNKILGIETEIVNWKMKQNANNNFVTEPPYEKSQQREACLEILEELTERDQKMFFCNITLVHLADSKEELDEDTERFKAIARGCSFELTPLYLSQQQLNGLNTVLPYGLNKLNMYRTLLTQSAATIVPFRAQEIIDKGGIYHGQNQITLNPIICNKECLQNPNAFVFGVPGSGKSFLSKHEIESIIMRKGEDVLICDPENEYSEIVRELGGEVINIGANSNDHINAMDISEGYGDSGNSIGDKSQFIMSIFEQLDKENGISSIERSIIDRCVSLTYKDARRNKYVPTLKTLRQMLLAQPEAEAKELAIKLELFTEGTLNIFAHETNVDVNNRIISYNILSLGKQLKTVGLLVITDAILNRVNENWQKGRRTHVFIDEIHVVFENEESLIFFSSAWRQFRKRNAFPTGITQNISYLLDTQYGRDMISNSEFIVMMNQSYNDRKVLAEILNISPETLIYIENAQPGSGIIRYGSSLVPFKNEIPKNNPLYVMNTTKVKEKI